MPNYIISGLLGGKVFAATNEAVGSPCWTLLKVKDVEVESSSMNSSNPTISEDASEAKTFVSLLESDINTLKIIQPSRMRITAFCEDAQSIESLISSFEDTKMTVQIQTKGITAKSLVMVSLEIDQNPNMMSATKVIIDLEQAAPATNPSTFNPAQSANASAYGASIQTPTKLPTTVAALYNRVSNLLKGL